MTSKDKIMLLPTHEPHRCSAPLVDRAAVLKIMAERDALLHRAFVALRWVSRCAVVRVAPLIEATCISEGRKKEITELVKELEKE